MSGNILLHYIISKQSAIDQTKKFFESHFFSVQGNKVTFRVMPNVKGLSPSAVAAKTGTYDGSFYVLHLSFFKIICHNEH